MVDGALVRNPPKLECKSVYKTLVDKDGVELEIHLN